MSELSPKAAAFVRAGRTAFGPEAADRERVLQLLTRTLGEGALLLDGTQNAEPATRSSVSRFPMRAKVLGAMGALAAGASLVVALHVWKRTTPALPPTPVISSVLPAIESEPLPATSTEDERIPVPPAFQSPSEAPTRGPRSSPARSSSDSLPEEVRLVSKAEQQLYAGRADDALKTLGEHERRFPNGALTELRMAARVQSLCTLGRIADAKADLAKLARAYPQSPQLDRTRRFCAIDMP
jgi:hypothetical protein